MVERKKLSARRDGEAIAFEQRQVRYRAQVSRFSDGTLSEIFIEGGKIGTDAHVTGHDAAVAISIALQFGAPVETLLHALEKLSDGSPAGAVGVALAKFVASP